MAKTKTQKRGMYPDTKRHYEQVYQVVQRLINTETWEGVFSDIQLAAMVRAHGVWASKPVIRSVRKMYKIPCPRERKRMLFTVKDV